MLLNTHQVLYIVPGMSGMITSLHVDVAGCYALPLDTLYRCHSRREWWPLPRSRTSSKKYIKISEMLFARTKVQFPNYFTLINFESSLCITTIIPATQNLLFL